MEFLLTSSICAVAVSVAAVRFFRRNFIFHVFSAMYLILFIVVPITHFSFFGYAIQMRGTVYGPLTNEVYFHLYSLVNLFISTGLLVASYSRFFQLPNWNFREQDLRLARNWSLLFVLLGVGAFFQVIDGYSSMLRGEFLTILTRGRMDHYDTDGGAMVRAIAYYCASFLPVLAFSSTMIRKNRVIFIACVILLAVMMLVLTGGRKWVIMIVSGIFAARFFAGRFSVRDYIVAVFAVFFLIAWQFVRSTRFQSGEWETSDLMRPFLEGDIIYFYYASLESIRQFYENDLFHPFATIRAILFLPFPAEWTFGLKIRDLAHLTNFFYSPVSFREANNPPGLIGLSFINLGLAGILILGVLAISIQGLLKCRMPDILKVCLVSTAIYLEVRLLRGSIGGIYIVIFQVAVLAGVWSLRGILRATRDMHVERGNA